MAERFDNQQAEQNADAAIAKARMVHLEALRWVMSDRKGQYYVGYLVEKSGALDRLPKLTGEDALYGEGRRDMGFLLMEELQELGQPGQPAGHLAKLIGTIKRVPKLAPKKTEEPAEDDDNG